MKRGGRTVASNVVVVRPQPDELKPVAPADKNLNLKQARAALEAVLAQAKEDRHLKPREGEAVKVEVDGTETSLRYETPDNWPDLPSKPAGPRPGNGSVQV